MKHRVQRLLLALLAAAAHHVDARGLNALPNMRTLGGIPCHGGRVVRDGLIYRSASPANATADDVHVLCNHVNLRSVVDLRAQKEGEKDVGARLLQAAGGPFPVRELPEVDDAEAAARATYHFNLLDDGILRKGVRRIALKKPRLLATMIVLGSLRKLLPSSRLRTKLKVARDVRLAQLLSTTGLDSVYEIILELRRDEIANVLKLCSRPALMPLLLHCTHCKDRTGVVSALLLHICGASREDIIDDYALSNEWGCSPDGKWAMAKSLPPHLLEHVDLDPWCEANGAFMEAALDTIEVKYGSLDAYLDQIGIRAEERQAIREVMLVPQREVAGV